MDILAIETFTWTPHLETTAEICVTEAQAGRSIGFAFIQVDNPDCQQILSWRERMLGAGPRNKVARLRPLLQSQGVAWIEPPKVPAVVRRASNRFATQPVRTIDNLKKLHYKGASLGIGVASSLISKTMDPSPDVTELRNLIIRYLRASATVFESASALLKEHRPKAILIFNGRFACSKAIVEAARQLKVECLFHERGATIDRYIVQPDCIHSLAVQRRCISEMWAQAGPERAGVGRSFFARRRQGDGIGWKSFTDRQVQGVLPMRRHNRRIVYFSSSEDEYAAVEGVCLHSCFDSQRDAIEFLVKWIRDQTDVELVIRLHPNMCGKPEADTRYWDTLKGSNVIVDPPDSETDSYGLAESADLVITYYSTMGVEAAFWGKPVLLLSDSAYRGLDCVYEPQTPEEVVALLGQSVLPPKPKENCLPYGYYASTFGTSYRFYQPKSLFEGSFLGVRLTMEPEYRRRFRTSRLGQRVRDVRQRLGDVRGSI